MITPTDNDIGRPVVYMRYNTREIGVINSFNDQYVFVRYGTDRHTKGTLRGDLYWYDEAREPIR